MCSGLQCKATGVNVCYRPSYVLCVIYVFPYLYIVCCFGLNEWLLADEFNCVRFCAYRTAMKLRQLQQKLRRTYVTLVSHSNCLSVPHFSAVQLVIAYTVEKCRGTTWFTPWIMIKKWSICPITEDWAGQFPTQCSQVDLAQVTFLL